MAPVDIYDPATNKGLYTPLKLSTTKKEPHYITIKHPCFSAKAGSDKFLRFRTFDTETGGMHYGTVILACGIIACNRFDGVLTTDQKGAQALELDNEDVMPAGTYYYHLQPPSNPVSDQPLSDPYPYPIFPSFADWKFPHDSMPSWWTDEALHDVERVVATADVSMAVLQRDDACCVTRSKDTLQRAHLCPKSEAQWFSVNDMQSYCALSSRVDDITNSISLRADLHIAFDSQVFVIVKKKGSWVANFFLPTSETAQMYHNSKAIIHEQVRPEFLFARFAWTLFQMSPIGPKDFLSSGPRPIIKFENGDWVEMTANVSDQTPSGKRKKGGNTSASKKGRTNSNAPDDSGSRMTSSTSETNTSNTSNGSDQTPSCKRKKGGGTSARSKKGRTKSNAPNDSSSRNINLAKSDSPYPSSVELNIWKSVDPKELGRIQVLRWLGLKEQRERQPPMCCDYVKASQQPLLKESILCEKCRGDSEAGLSNRSYN
jgi:HNH endonuclease